MENKIFIYCTLKKKVYSNSYEILSEVTPIKYSDNINKNNFILF